MPVILRLSGEEKYCDFDLGRLSISFVLRFLLPSLHHAVSSFGIKHPQKLVPAKGRPAFQMRADDK